MVEYSRQSSILLMYMHACRQSVYVFQNYTRFRDNSLRSYANFERYLLVVMNDDDISQSTPLGLLTYIMLWALGPARLLV